MADRSYKVIESRFTVDVGRYVIRVWRDESELKESYDFTDLRYEINRFVYRYGAETATKADFAEMLIKMDRVAAVEVCDAPEWGSQGIVLYREWP
jgi:hypothetical protein